MAQQHICFPGQEKEKTDEEKACPFLLMSHRVLHIDYVHFLFFRATHTDCKKKYSFYFEQSCNPLKMESSVILGEDDNIFWRIICFLPYKE